MPKGLRPITTYNVFLGASYGGDSGVQTVTAAAPITSVAFDLREVAQDGFFSVSYTVATTGTMALTYTVCSKKDGAYFTPTGGGSIVSGLTTGTGGIAFEPEMYPFIKIVATATTQTGTVLCHLNIQ